MANTMINWLATALEKASGSTPKKQTAVSTPYPAGFPASEQGGNREVFDPALQHFARGFRLTDPVFESDADASRWHRARRDVIRHLIGVVSRLPQSANLVLRGSLLLTAWLGDDAREPGDMDWVIVPETVDVSDEFASALMGDIVLAATAKPLVSEAVLLSAQIAQDPIWLYDRAPGTRLVFPWQVDGLPVGTVQMDFVFNETLRTPPAPVVLPYPWSDGKPVLAASPQESLAWKILWLETDAYTQGKDIYDATLLAERVALPWDLLHSVLLTDEWYRSHRQTAPLLRLTEGRVEWEDFQREYPHIVGSAEDWQDRLVDALAGTFAEREASR
ncbi:MAG: nucleotidyl transferase AbiEii/AbiGii toxin family protein [Armatimonadetes bacterium]|nr:nucleotidyl transferase AbiEii/AbiGii toxin family protein [Armatimonadota bacterium]